MSRHCRFRSLLPLLLVSAWSQAATITVNSSADTVADDGVCTLREAITAANTNLSSGVMAGECAAGEAMQRDDIVFAIPGEGPHVIQVGEMLPVITQSVKIDGYTQPGAVPNSINTLTGFDADLRIVLDGSQSAPVSKPGLRIQGAGASGSEIRGLVIRQFTSPSCCADNGIHVSGAPNVVIAGNHIHGNRSRGIFSQGASHNLRVGGPEPADRNLVHGHTFSDAVTLSNNVFDIVVENNLLGIRFEDGLPVQSRNLSGVVVSGTSRSRVRDNWIAVNTTGIGVEGNAMETVLSNNLIGGSIGNGIGISISNGFGLTPRDTLVEGNVITGNTGVAVQLVNFQSNPGHEGHVLRGNRIVGNTGLGIDLAANGGPADGVTANDPGDLDEGPNGLQNYPVLGAPVQVGNNLHIPYNLDSADALYDIEFSFSSACHGSGHGPGGNMSTDPFRLTDQMLMGTAVMVPVGVPENGFVSATATGALGTSEFSACVPYSYAVQTRIFLSGFETTP